MCVFCPDLPPGSCPHHWSLSHTQKSVYPSSGSLGSSCVQPNAPPPAGPHPLPLQLTPGLSVQTESTLAGDRERLEPWHPFCPRCPRVPAATGPPTALGDPGRPRALLLLPGTCHLPPAPPHLPSLLCFSSDGLAPGWQQLPCPRSLTPADFPGLVHEQGGDGVTEMEQYQHQQLLPQSLPSSPW